jgi:uncharacterized protein YgiM (DUF1202 family)
MNKKTAKLLTFTLLIGGATAIYLYFLDKNKKDKPPLPPKKKVGKVYLVGIVNTTNTDLNVREEPNTTSKIVAKLKKGSMVTVSVIENNDSWYLLVDNVTDNKIGYVSTQYIKMVE